MEAMKMEMTLEAPRDAIVLALHIQNEALVAGNTVLIEFSESDT